MAHRVLAVRVPLAEAGCSQGSGMTVDALVPSQTTGQSEHGLGLLKHHDWVLYSTQSKEQQSHILVRTSEASSAFRPRTQHLNSAEPPTTWVHVLSKRSSFGRETEGVAYVIKDQLLCSQVLAYSAYKEHRSVFLPLTGCRRF